ITLLLTCHTDPRDLHSFPTRRSSDLKQSDVVVEAEYRTPILHHSCLETHGNVVEYRGGDEATVYASTQGTFTIPGDAADSLGLRSEEHTSELQSRENLVCRLLLEKKK